MMDIRHTGLRIRLAGFSGNAVRAFVAVILALAALPLAAVDRDAFTFTHYSLKASVRPAEHDFEAEGTLELRNDSDSPQRQLALQISSSLAWKRISMADGQPISYITQDYTSDIDHTGALEEAIVTLPQPVPPRGTVKLEVSYAGEITRDSGRLLRIGAPDSIALASDWDEIGDTFGAVRGLGYVTWYPVSIEAVSLSEGTSVFTALERWKRRHAQTTLSVKLSLASSPGASQLSLVTNGRAAEVAAGAGSEAEFSSSRGARVAAASVRAEFPAGSTPVFVFGEFVKMESPALTVFHSPAARSVARDYADSAEAAERVLADWFGPLKRKPELIGLPDPNAVPFESGTMLLAPLRSSAGAPDRELLLARTLVRANIASPRKWIADGLARFGQALVCERQAGRAAANEFLGRILPALIPAERFQPEQAQDGSAATPASTPAPNANSGAGQAQRSLINTDDEVLYSGKAAYVWWMLRDMVGDAPLIKAIAAYRPAQDRQASYMQGLVENQFTPRKDLEAFFDSWVYRDLGLPDFRIEATNARRTLENNFVVSVTVENLTPVWSEVPVIVHSVNDQKRLGRIQVPGKEKATTRIVIQGAPSLAEVNDGSVPVLDSSNNKREVASPPDSSSFDSEPAPARKKRGP